MNIKKSILWFFQLLVHKWFCNYGSTKDEFAVISLFDNTVPSGVQKHIGEVVNARKGIDSKDRRFIIDKTNHNKFNSVM